MTFGDVRWYLYSHGSREPKHPNKSFIKKFGSIKTITYLCETYIPQMYVRENLCVWVFFLKKSLIDVWILKIKYYLCTRIRNKMCCSTQRSGVEGIKKWLSQHRGVPNLKLVRWRNWSIASLGRGYHTYRFESCLNHLARCKR